MSKFLIPLLAVLAVPTAVNATNYVECEAIYAVVSWLYRIWEESDFETKDYEDAYDRAKADFRKRGCYYY